jgi:sec-independent protein translocase protein TatA
MLAEIIGPDLVIVVIVVAIVLLFGGTKLPKIARNLGSAKSEFEKGVRESSSKSESATSSEETPK